MAVSEAKKRAVMKYDKTHYEVRSVKFPIGTLARISALGETISGFASSATLRALDEAEARAKQGPGTREETPDTRTRASNADTRASKVDARASNVIELPPDVYAELQGYGDPQKITLAAVKNVLKMYGIVM